MITTSKYSVRQEIFAKLRAIPPKTRDAASTTIREAIASSPHWKPEQTILLFAALPSEPNLTPLINKAPKGARLLFPLVTNLAHGAMTFHHVTSLEQLAPTQSRIPEPNPKYCPAISPQEITTAFIPGVAFDPSTGNRLGRGGGFYDRLLAHPEFTATTTGICFALQQRSLITDPHDRPVNSLITEDRSFALPRG